MSALEKVKQEWGMEGAGWEWSGMTLKQQEEKASHVDVWSKRIFGGGNPESGTGLEYFRHSEASRRGRSERWWGVGGPIMCCFVNQQKDFEWYEKHWRVLSRQMHSVKCWPKLNIPLKKTWTPDLWLWLVYLHSIWSSLGFVVCVCACPGPGLGWRE